MGQFGSQASEMIQQTKEELISKRGKLEIISGQYIQDLYRFFKLYPGHLDFDDIFTSALDFHNLPILQPYVSDEESLTTIAEYYLRKNYFLTHSRSTIAYPTQIKKVISYSRKSVTANK